jgi:hypothetical protein
MSADSALPVVALVVPTDTPVLSPEAASVLLRIIRTEHGRTKSPRREAA